MAYQGPCVAYSVRAFQVFLYVYSKSQSQKTINHHAKMETPVRMVALLTGDEITGQTRILVPYNQAIQSKLVTAMLADDEDDDVPEIPLLEVSAEVLTKVVEFMAKHENDPMKEIAKPITTNNLEEIVGKWDADFVNLEQEPLFKLILAANFLDLPSLLDLGICKVACMVKGKDPEQVRALFNIDPDITPEEEKMVRDQNEWIFMPPKAKEATAPPAAVAN